MFKLDDSQLTHEILQEYRTDRAYGCYTRNCLELEIWPVVAEQVRYVVFCDIDQMHTANDVYGYDAVDNKIRSAISNRESDIVAARWYSGDELVFLILEGDRMGNSVMFVERIQARLFKEGLSATFGIVEMRAGEICDPQMAVGRAARLVQAAKKAGQISSIHTDLSADKNALFAVPTLSIVS